MVVAWLFSDSGLKILMKQSLSFPLTLETSGLEVRSNS